MKINVTYPRIKVKVIDTVADEDSQNTVGVKSLVRFFTWYFVLSSSKLTAEYAYLKFIFGFKSSNNFASTGSGSPTLVYMLIKSSFLTDFQFF